MLKKLCLLIFSLISMSIAWAQQIQFSEPVNDKYTRFFFDENYYLVDKNCEFKAIERVAQFDTDSLRFNGQFKDFNRFGKLILEGNYINGKKEGKFMSYHPNGQIKWEANYVYNEPLGYWNYYYPDGKPLLTLSFTKEDYSFVNFWDNKGNQRIKDGFGEYKMTMPIIGYTDQGYLFYVRQGKVENGKPQGYWITSYVVDDKKNVYEPLFEETFEKGEQTSISFNEAFIDEYLPIDDFVLVPSDYFPRGESMMIKNCNFDEFSGFYSYTKRKFQYYIDLIEFKPQDRTLDFSMKYNVNKEGLVYNKRLLKSPEKLKYMEKSQILEIFEKMFFFIPSILENQPIKDDIIISISLGQQGGKLSLKEFYLKREKGQ